MTTPNDVLKKAAGEIGYYAPNDPEPGSKYGRWMAKLTGESWLAGPSTSIWWCMIFVSWCFYTSGMTNIPGLPNYNCDNFKSKASSIRVPNKRDAKPGDIVLFDWNGDGSCDHVGIVEKNYGDYIQTIEGNTSGSNAGSQSSGNGVWRRTRSWGSINSVFRPKYTGNSPMWVKDSKGWWYSLGGSKYYSSCWSLIDGKWYHFNAAGYAQTGWIKDGGKWYYLYKPGDKGTECSMATGWLKYKDYWYYLSPESGDNKGAMVTGWIKLGDKWYYLRPKEENGHPEGSMVKGWYKWQNNWYYLNRAADDGTEGAMRIGWFKDGDKWAYLRPKKDGSFPEGSAVCNTEVTIDGKKYKFDKNCYMV